LLPFAESGRVAPSWNPNEVHSDMKTKPAILSVALVLLSAGWPHGPSAADEPLENMHVIDWHAHAAGLGYGGSGAFINEQLRNNFRFRFFLKWMGATEKELAAEGDQIIIRRMSETLSQSKYVDQVVVLAMDGIVDPVTGVLDRENTQLYVPNEYVARETAKYPNLLFGASINPNRKNSIELLEQAAAQGAVLVKWIPSIMAIDPSDPSFIPFYRKMAELGIPLLIHTGMEKSFTHAHDELSDPLNLALPLRHGVTVIAAHLGATGKSEGQDNFERLLQMFAAYPNLYADISSLTQINRLGYLVKALKVPGLAERLLYGTDWPLQFFPLVSPWFHVQHVGVAAARRVAGIDNPWDRDVALKQALGVPQTVFSRVVGIPAMKHSKLRTAAGQSADHRYARPGGLQEIERRRLQ
jgi:predicted TIM-barrel fold metal-dependent hydrolase